MKAINRYNCNRLILQLIIWGVVISMAPGGCGGGGNSGDDNSVDENQSTASNCDYNVDIFCEDTIGYDGEPCEKKCYKNDGRPSDFILHNDKLIFTARVGCLNEYKYELLEIDNSLNVKQILDQFSFSSFNPISMNDTLYFTAGEGIWKYDGVNDAEEICTVETDINIGIGSLMVYKDEVLYEYVDYNNEYDEWFKLYSCNSAGNGEEIGTVEVRGQYIVYKDKLYFNGKTNDFGFELWCYDNAADPKLSMVGDINPGGGHSFPMNYIIFQDQLFFSASDGETDGDLWMFDGENPPSKVVASGYEEIKPVAVFNNKLICMVEKSSGTTVLYEYDGSGLAPINIDNSYNIRPNITGGSSYVVFNDNFYFIAEDPSEISWISNGYLWVYDGYNAPEKIDTETYVRHIYPIDTSLLLQGDTEWFDFEIIYRYDGVHDPVVLFVADMTEQSEVFLEAVFNDYYFVTGYSDRYGYELWMGDDTGKIDLFKDFYPGTFCWCDCNEP